MAKFPEIKTGTIFSAGVLNPYGEFFVGGHVFDQLGDVT